MSKKNHTHRQTVEFGDFQTPPELTDEICHFLFSTGVRPESVIEPTCGTGGFIVSAMDTFEQTRKFFGNEINREYLQALEQKLRGTDHTRIELKNEDFFSTRLGKYFDPSATTHSIAWQSALGNKFGFGTHSGIESTSQEQFSGAQKDSMP